MKKQLTFLPYNAIDQLPIDELAFIEDDIYLCGFKKTAYQSLEFDVCIDGELYNTEEITKELVLSNFKHPTSIEEVFLFSYLLWGNEAMRKLEGSYSLTIRKGKTILSIKDPMGTKPIYYMKNKKGIWLSNCIDTILEYSKEVAVLDKSSIVELFAFGPSLSENETLFKNIKALPMGSILSVRDHEIQVERYYDLPVHTHEDSLEETIAKVHDLVHTSVLHQSQDCKASFLSGGLDSSIITSICTKNNTNWHTYSLDYEGNAENFKGNMFQVSLDQQFIDEMLAYCNHDHTKLTITQKELVDTLDDAMRARNMPGMGDIDSSLLWLCEQVAKEERIILSGECGDEVFGGYPWFYREEFKDVKTFPWLRYSEQRIQLLNKNIQSLDYQGYVDKRYQETLAMVKYLDSDTEADKKARLNTVLVLHWFMQTLVTRQVCEGDKANVNIRAPFANVKLLEYVYNIPWSMKFLNGEEKGILRKAFEDELPTIVAHRKKNPFPKTHNPIYAEKIAEKVKERFDDPQSSLHVLFDDEKLKELIDSKGASYPLPWYGQLMSGPQLLAYIYQIDRWVSEYHVVIE